MFGNNPLGFFMQFLNNGGNPQQLAEQALQQNPQLKQTMEYLYNNSRGQSPKDLAMQLARQKGIDPSQLMQIANKMGLR